MLPRGLTESRWSLLPLAAAALLVGGCSLVGGGAPVAVTADAPPPALAARFAAAVDQLSSGDEAAATAAFGALATEYPAYAGPVVNLALIHARRGDDGRALAYLAEAAGRCERCGVVWNELGVIRRRAGRLGDAELAYRRAIELEPGYGLAYYNLAVLYDLYLQQPRLALDLYRQYLDGTPDPALSAAVSRWVSDLERRVQAPATAALVPEES